MKKWLIILSLVTVAVGGALVVGCGRSDNGDATTDLYLKVTEPQDESIVYTPEVTVRGETTPDAVVTVNGTIADVDADGKFSVTVVLEEDQGWIIEVFASDFEGREASQFLSVIVQQ